MRRASLVTGLTREAFEVYEDGERQTITQFTNERVPVGLGMLLDIERQHVRPTDRRRAAAPWSAFSSSCWTPPTSGSCWRSTTIRTSSAAGPARRARFATALGGIKPSGGTAIYDAVIGALPMIARRPRERAAMVVISDGADTASDATIAEVRKALLRSEAFVYADRDRFAEAAGHQHACERDGALSEITGQSGGRTEIVRDMDGLEAATARIAEELNSQYVFAYASPRATDGKYHSIRVRVTLPGHKVRARNGYVGVAKPRSDPD